MGAPFIHLWSNMIVLVYKTGTQAYKNMNILRKKKKDQSSFAQDGKKEKLYLSLFFTMNFKLHR